jgi:hypothetical protein
MEKPLTVLRVNGESDPAENEVICDAARHFRFDFEFRGTRLIYVQVSTCRPAIRRSSAHTHLSGPVNSTS